MSNISNQSVPEVKGPRNYVQLSDGSDDLAFNENIYITSDNVINPSAIGVDNLQDTCEAGHVTTTSITCDSLFTDPLGSVNTNTISAVLGTNVDFSNTYRGDLSVQTLVGDNGIVEIEPEFVRGDIVFIKALTVSGVWVLPQGNPGNHLYFVNGSGNTQQIKVDGAGGNIDTLSGITVSGAAPFVIKLVCISTGTWFSSNV
jgi:hypothetical protein